LLAAAAAAQSDDPVSDPLPSKTPTATADSAALNDIEPTAAPLASDASPSPIEEPFIQADLSILSGNVQRPNAIFWHNQQVYAACNGDWTIYEIDAETGATVTYLWGVKNAHTLHVEDDDNGDLNIWVPDFQANALVHIYQRSINTIAEELEGPWGIAPYKEGFLITNLLAGEVVYSSRTGEIRQAAQGFRYPAGIAVDEDIVYIANNGSARRAIEWFGTDAIADGALLDASEEGAVTSLISGLQNPTGLVLGTDGYLYFAYSLGTRWVIGRIDPEMCREKGGCENSEVEIVVYTDLAAPLAGLALSPDGKLYTHTIFSPDIYYVDMNGAAQGVAAP